MSGARKSPMMPRRDQRLHHGVPSGVRERHLAAAHARRRAAKRARHRSASEPSRPTRRMKRSPSARLLRAQRRDVDAVEGLERRLERQQRQHRRRAALQPIDARSRRDSRRANANGCACPSQPVSGWRTTLDDAGAPRSANAGAPGPPFRYLYPHPTARSTCGGIEVDVDARRRCGSGPTAIKAPTACAAAVNRAHRIDAAGSIVDVASARAPRRARRARRSARSRIGPGADGARGRAARRRFRRCSGRSESRRSAYSSTLRSGSKPRRRHQQLEQIDRRRVGDGRLRPRPRRSAAQSCAPVRRGASIHAASFHERIRPSAPFVFDDVLETRRNVARHRAQRVSVEIDHAVGQRRSAAAARRGASASSSATHSCRVVRHRVSRIGERRRARAI